jgi:hypothetical protein
VFSFPGVQSDSAATVVQTAGGVLEYMYMRPMRPMYATLYSYPSRVSLINQEPYIPTIALYSNECLSDCAIYSNINKW